MIADDIIDWDRIPDDLTWGGFIFKSPRACDIKMINEWKKWGKIGSDKHENIVREINETRMFIRLMCKPRERINKKRSSYGLKHDAESVLPCSYVSNGSFIAAAILEGYRYRRYADSPNVDFAMSIDFGRINKMRLNREKIEIGV